MKVMNPTVRWGLDEDCWLYSIDNGQNWIKLIADDRDNRYSAIEEVVEITEIESFEWNIED